MQKCKFRFNLLREDFFIADFSCASPTYSSYRQVITECNVAVDVLLTHVGCGSGIFDLQTEH